MNEEKMKILKMLEEGRISADDAARLLESLGGGENKASSQNSYSERSSQQAADKGHNSPTDDRRNLENMAADAAKKFGAFAKNMEPKLTKLTEVMAEKTISVTDKISKSFSSGTSYAKPVQFSSDSASEQAFEAIVTPGYNELNIMGTNGNVSIKGYNGDKITAKVSARAKSSGAKIELMQLGSKYLLHYDEDLFDNVSVDAYVPETMFSIISITTINGSLEATTLRADSITITNSNGATLLKNLRGNSIKADCNNGRLELNNITGENGSIENFNGDISGGDLDIANLILSGLNGSVSMIQPRFSNHSDYIWAIEASNGRLSLNMPSDAGLGYHIKANAALSQIKIGLTGLNYIANTGAYVEAKSINYESAARKIKLSMETSNGPLTLN